VSKDIVYFDLETQKTAGDVGGWGRKDAMGMSIGVTYSTKLGAYKIYPENRVHDLIEQLRRADLVVGFNTVDFDYAVLMGYTILNLRTELRSLDLLSDLEQRIGRKIKLESFAQATLGIGKIADGLDAIKWWREGKILEIAEYCCFDVKVTKLLHEHGAKHKSVSYDDRNSNQQTVPVEWEI